jgi:DNA transformation protein and related proteins
MAVDENFKNYILDQLSEFPEVQSKNMFGGAGFFLDGTMFAMIGGGVFRLRADEQTVSDFESRGMELFQPNKLRKGMPYWEVPVDVFEDKHLLKEWAIKAYEAALRAKK